MTSPARDRKKDFIFEASAKELMVLYVKDILETDFLSLPEETSVLDGARRMKETRHGFTVVGSVLNPKGIVTEWDILEKVVAEGRDTSKVTLGEIMSSNIAYVRGDTGIATLAQIMSQKGVRRMIVKDGDRVVGFVTAKTVLARLNEYIDKVSSQISSLQAPWF